jgi:8-oxo-dGTP pyrophosphatase MutT (NUDIX family)
MLKEVGVDSITFIIYDWKKDKYALIHESKPPIDERNNEKMNMTTAFGGSLDDNTKEPIEICIQEVEEEAGYIVTTGNIQYCGKFLVSTQMSQFCYGYLVDVTGMEKTSETEAERSTENESIKWLTKEEIFLNTNDWKAITIISKADFIKGSEYLGYENI